MIRSESSENRSNARRRTAVLAGVVCALGVLVAACGPDPAPAPSGVTAPPDAVTSTVYHRTNADRAARGLPGLGWDAQLHGLAAEWAQYLADTQQFRHRDLRAAFSRPGFEVFRSLGENILVGPRGITGDQMQDAWLASPSHYANIVGSFDSMGVAVAHGADGNVRAVVNFGRH